MLKSWFNFVVNLDPIVEVIVLGACLATIVEFGGHYYQIWKENGLQRKFLARMNLSRKIVKRKMKLFTGGSG